MRALANIAHIIMLITSDCCARCSSVGNATFVGCIVYEMSHHFWESAHPNSRYNELYTERE